MRSSNQKAPEDKLGKILSYLVAISTIIGIPTGLYSYLSSLHDKKVERTYEYYRDFRSEAFQKEWVLLLTRWNEKASEVKQILEVKDFARLQSLASGLINQDDAGKTAFAKTIGFFDESYACIENELCDHNVAVVLLKSPASEFVSAFGSYIISVRKDYNNAKYGAGAYKIRALEKKFSVL